MRKILSLIGAMLLTISVSAQKILGIDINTTSKKFAMVMLKKGYKPTEKVSGETTYNVTYAGYKGAKMVVRFDEANDSINEVCVYFDKRTKDERSDIYNNLQEQFKVKYPNGEASRHDVDIINTHQRWFTAKGVHMVFDEVTGKFWITYLSRYTPKKKVVKPSSDI